MGFGSTVAGYDPTALENLNDPEPRASIGEEVHHNGSWYMYVKFDNGAGNIASVINQAAYWTNRLTGVVSSDKTGSQFGAALPNGVAGIFQTAVTDQYFTWIQRRGYRARVRLSGAGAIGNKIHAPAADTDLILTTVADGTAVSSGERVGTQLAAADGNNDAPVSLQIIS